jgi:hypothetical protein
MIQTVHYLSVESPPLTLLMIRQTSSLSERPIGDPPTETRAVCRRPALERHFVPVRFADRAA